MPTLSFGLLGSLGAGENRSVTSSEGFGYTFEELAGACEGAVFPGNLDFAWRCFALSNSSAGKTGYSRPSEGAG
jgi:hypothetical protein